MVRIYMWMSMNAEKAFILEIYIHLGSFLTFLEFLRILSYDQTFSMPFELYHTHPTHHQLHIGYRKWFLMLF